MTAAELPATPRLPPIPFRMPSARVWADITVLSLLSILGVVGFESSFGGNGYLASGLGGLAVGVAIGVASYSLRLGALTTTLLSVVAYFLLGAVIAVPSQAIFGFIPTLESSMSLATGAVFGWADIVTLKTPVGAPAYIAAVPYVATWLVGLVFTVLATRWLTARPRTAWRSAVVLSGPALLYLIGILTGTDDAYLAGFRGVSFAVVSLVWLGWRRPSGAKGGKNIGNAVGPPLLRRKLIGTAIVVGASVLIGATVGALVAPTAFNRFVLRDEIQPPFDPLDYPSPLAGFRHYTKDAAESPLFTVDGMKPGERIRLATMDSYTGKLWNVAGPQVATDGSGTFSLVGQEFPEPMLVTAGGERTMTITIDKYSDVWIPSIGYPLTIAFDGEGAGPDDKLRYNTSTGSAVLTSGVRSVMTYTVTSEVQKVLTPDQLADIAPARLQLPPVDNVPDIVYAKAEEFAGDAATPIAKLVAIEAALTGTGYLSHGLKSDAAKSQAGHGADRMNILFTREPMVGDEEQYASAFALMARHFGYPARVVMGFAPDVASPGSPVTVTGSDITAWVEVAFEGVGWIPFDPTPEQTDAPQDQTTTPKSEPLPQVRQPPRANQNQSNLLSPVAIDKSDDEEGDGFAIPNWAFAVAGIVGIPALLYFVPVVVIGALKRRRVKKRRTRGDGDDKVAGAWDELTDTYAELGYSVSRNHSRLQTAASIQAQFAEQLERRERERSDAENARAAREARRLSRTSREGKAGASDVLRSGVVRVRELAAWRPGVATADEELPGMPELYGVASTVDEAVFSGRDVDDLAVESAWHSALDSASDARRTVSWTRRQLSRFRIRPKRDWLEVLTKAAGLELPKSLKSAVHS